MSAFPNLTTFAKEAEALGAKALLSDVLPAARKKDQNPNEELRLVFRGASDEDLLGYARDKVLRAHEDQVQKCLSDLKKMRDHAKTKQAWRRRK